MHDKKIVRKSFYFQKLVKIMISFKTLRYNIEI